MDATAVAAPLPEGFNYNNSKNEYNNILENKNDEKFYTDDNCLVSDREKFVYEYLNKNEFRTNNTNVRLEDLLNISKSNKKISLSKYLISLDNTIKIDELISNKITEPCIESYNNFMPKYLTDKYQTINR